MDRHDEGNVAFLNFTNSSKQNTRRQGAADIKRRETFKNVSTRRCNSRQLCALMNK